MNKRKYIWVGLLVVMTWHPLPAETPSIVSQLVEKAQTMATENVGLKAIRNRLRKFARRSSSVRPLPPLEIPNRRAKSNDPVH